MKKFTSKKIKDFMFQLNDKNIKLMVSQNTILSIQHILN